MLAGMLLIYLSYMYVPQYMQYDLNGTYMFMSYVVTLFTVYNGVSKYS